MVDAPKKKNNQVAKMVLHPEFATNELAALQELAQTFQANSASGFLRMLVRKAWRKRNPGSELPLFAPLPIGRPKERRSKTR